MNNSADPMDKVVFMLTEFSRGNFLVREEVTEEEDPMNTVVAGLNMLGEELDNYKTEINRQRELLTRIITSSDQVFYIILLDQENPFKNTFTYLNTQVEKVIGYTVDDVRNDPLMWINAIHSDDIESMMSITKEMFSSKKPVTRVYRMKHKHTQEYVWLEDYVVPILDENGWIREFYASARDITARKIAEMEREKLIIELTRRHDELMQFNNIVSHNLRSPVASILGLAQFLQGEMPEDELHETTSYILQAAHAMDDLLHDLNAILSARTTVKEKMEIFSLPDLITSVCISLKNEITKSNAIINTQIDSSANELLSIKSFIQSAIYNLVSNAIKYSVADRLPIITISAYKEGNGHTVIAVEDNGRGIDLQLHGQRLFVLYSRLSIDREGKGLGLYMTKTQIEALDGKLEVESEPGRGSIFTITL